MSHLHIPDGLLPLPLLLGSYAICALLLAVAAKNLRQRGLGDSMSRIGAVSAFMLLAMSLPLGPLPVHLNLAVLSGIIIGPWSGIISVFVVNLILALSGHGGITVLGLNALIVIVEMLVGCGMFRLLSRIIRPSRAAAASVALALVCSLAITVSILSVVRLDVEEVLAHDRDPHEGHSGIGSSLSAILPLSLAGIAAESLVVAGVVGYLYRVRPDLIGKV